MTCLYPKLRRDGGEMRLWSGEFERVSVLPLLLLSLLPVCLRGGDGMEWSRFKRERSLSPLCSFLLPSRYLVMLLVTITLLFVYIA